MKVIFSTEPIKYPLTGIARYSLELINRITVSEQIEDLKFFNGTKFIDEIPSLPNAEVDRAKPKVSVSSLLRRQKIIIDAYRYLHPRRQAYILRKYKDYIYHGPNYYLPHKLERSVTTFHDISIFTCPQYHTKDRVHYMKKALLESLHSASLILTVSEFSRKEIIDYFNYPAEKVITTKLACSDSYKPRDEIECRSILDKYQLAWQGYSLYIGTMEPRKNIKGLLQAYEMLPAELRSRYPIVLSGYRGWEDSNLWRIVDKGTREGWIQYLGYVPDHDLPYLYAAAKIFVYPSFYEGFGLPVLEAMSCGVPVVCSNVSSLPEVIGDAGLASDPNDVYALRDDIYKALQDISWRQFSKERGLELSKLFSWEDCAKKTIDAYKLIK